MSSEKEMIAFQKAAILELIILIGDSDKKDYTAEEIKDILLAYIKGKES